MAKRPSISTISSGYASTTTLNDNFEALQEAFDNTISRDGSTPNTMSADLDMNGNDIIGASSVLVGGVDYLAQSLAYKNAAETSKIAAEAAKVAAELAYDNFDDRYLGVKTSDPSTDNDGNALLDGALFFDTTLNVLKVYDQGNTVWKRTTPTTAEQANIDTVTGISSDVTAVSGISTNVTTVADNITDVNSVATNMAEVLTADTNAATATTKAAEASASATAAANSATSASTSATTASNQATAAATSASNAATSESNASTSASNAASSATSASGSATTATTQASNAASSASAASTSETNAANSATASATSASNSATSESNAATSASNASTSASDAATSATNASTSESNAATSATAAAASYDSFDDRYLGVKATAPSTDNDGDALTTGCLYYNSTVGQLYIWDGSAWDDAALSASGAVTAFNTRTGSVTLNSTDVLNASGLLNTGGTMTGALVLNADPSVALEAATKQYVDNEVAGIVDAAPATLDTLNELAAALGDDPNFATTTATNIGTKVSKSGDTMTGNLSFGDNDKAIFGAGSDLEIYHDSASGQSIIHENGPSVLKIRASDFRISNSANTKDYLSANDGAEVSIRHNGAVKLATTSTGISVTGDATFADNGKAIFGAGSDLQIYHDGAKSVIEDSGTGALQIKATDLEIRSSTTNENYIYCVENGAVTLYHNDAAKLATTSTGVDVTGTLTSDGLNVTRTGNGQIAVLQTSASRGFSFDSQSDTALQIASVQGSTNLDLWANTLTFSAGAAERLRLDASGNLLAGKTATGFGTSGIELRNDNTLWVTRNNNTPVYINRLTGDGNIVEFAKDGSTVGSIGTQGGNFKTNAATQDYYITMNGGIDNVGNDMWVQGNITPWVNGYYNLGQSNYKWQNLHLSGTANAANFNTTSDATLKTNVETLSGSLDAVKSLRGVSFDWLENGGSEIGVIAQEVEAVLPDVVSTNDEGIKSVKYGNMVAVLIEAIKEQQLRIEALEAQLNS